MASARRCSPSARNKLRHAALDVIAQARMLQNVWRHDGEQPLADATGALIEQVRQWPLLANFSNVGEQGITGGRCHRRTPQLAADDPQQPYFFSVGDQPQQVHWLGLTDKPGSYAYSHQRLSDWLQRRQAQPLTASDVIWEVTLTAASGVSAYRRTTAITNTCAGRNPVQRVRTAHTAGGLYRHQPAVLAIARYWRPGKTLGEAVTCG